VHVITVAHRRWSALAALLLPSWLGAQGVPALADSMLHRPDSLASVISFTNGSMGDAPADSAEGPLFYAPGVGASLAGISIRGAIPGQTGVLVNGIDVTPGTRGPWIELPVNGISQAWAVTGPRSARTAAGRALQFEIPSMADSVGARGSYASDRVMGASSLGLTRLDASGGFSGRNYRIFLAGLLLGQKSADFGTEARDIPVFAPVGLDTTVRFSPAGAAGDSVTMDIPAWGVTRGDCGQFAGSADSRIAGNYGADCTGDPTPSSAQSRYRVAINAEYDLNRTARLGFLALKSRTDQRNFDYASLANPANLGGDQELASVYAMTLAGQLGQGPTPGAYRIGVSRQVNQHIDGPLTPDGELHSRDPRLGLMLGGLDFRWDFESFPVDTQLVENYRLNRSGSRRSPYDLVNVDQYSLQNPYLDAPYGLASFWESGGPVGVLTLFRERRNNAFTDLAWASSRNSVFSIGGVYTKYDVTNYSHRLTSQILSDVYIEHPTSGALYAEQHFTYDRVELSAGLRYDFFSSNAERPATLDTLPFIPGTSQSNPDYGTYQQYPAISSYGAEGQTVTINGAVLPLRSTIKDQRHSAWSPRFRGSLRIGSGTVVRVGIAREVRMPDLAQVFTGVNTDLALTNLSQVFGTDLGYERSWQEELGIRQRLGDLVSLDLTGFHQVVDSAVTPHLANLLNPTRNNSPNSIRQYANRGHFGAQGFTTSLSYSAPGVDFLVSYQYLDTDQLYEEAGWNAWSRPHTLSATLHFRAPPSLRSGLLARAQLWAGFQLASGTSYLICRTFDDPMVNVLTMSDAPCTGSISTTSALRLPARKQLDLRFSKGLGDAAWAPRFFVDARNLLNFTSTIRAVRDSERAPVARENDIQNGLATIRYEATRNGVYDATTGTADLSAPGLCSAWATDQLAQAVPDCVALTRAEARWGNGDGLYTVDEQRTAIGAWFDATYLSSLNGPPRRIRIGIEFGI
jgi:hypothetical protein